MLTLKEFRKFGHQLVDWMADYYANIEKYPVKSQVMPREIFDRLPDQAPEQGESMTQVLADFEKIILPGLSHWQSPNFFAYFPANSSYPAILAEMLTATLASQCMIWETSPAAAELEEKMLVWLKQMLGLPSDWDGVIQDTASTATLVALLSAREKYSNFQVNELGLAGFSGLRIYCSTETHSSIEKAVKIAGLGRKNLVKIAVDDHLRMDPVCLRAEIDHDLALGLRPLAVVATLGTTGTTAVDPLPAIADICSHYKLWLHIDAAFAGTALLLPEFRWMIAGIEQADSFVFNPHKWMFTNFDCSAYFIKDRDTLIRTLTILPEYLKTQTRGQVNDYRDWGIQLGRRFRALKLWFVIRSFGQEGLRRRIRAHLQLAETLEQKIKNQSQFELMAPRVLSLVCFRWRPEPVQDPNELDQLNEALLHRLNRTGQLYLTHTRVKGQYTLRWVIGQTYVEQHHIDQAWNVLMTTIAQMQDH